MVYRLTPDGRDPWTQSRTDAAGNSDIHPQAPAGGGGPGRFTSPGPLGLDLAGGAVHPDAPAANTIQVSRVVLCSATTGGISGEVLVVRIGSIYKLEGFLDGQPVVYVGSAANIKTRFYGKKHEWGDLLRDNRTKVSMKRVYGNLDIPGSGQGTVRSATNEALRSQEERALREAEDEAKTYNERLKAGQPNKRVLNESRPATEEHMTEWEAKHKASTDEEWIVARETGSSTIIFRAFVGLQILDMILDAINHERTRKMEQYIRAPYVFLEEDGRSSFTLRTESSWWGFSTTYSKHYLTGGLGGKDIEITQLEFTKLKEEAEALYGYIDWWGDFVPGLLMPKLPVVNVGGPGMRA